VPSAPSIGGASSSAAGPSAPVVVSPRPSAGPPATATAPAVTASPTAVESPSSTPAPTATPRPTAAPTRRPAPSPEPSVRPTSTPRPTPKPTLAPVVVLLEANEFLFEPGTIEAPAGRTFTLAFTNSDGSIPHNVQIKSGGQAVFSGDLFVGVATVAYTVPSLEAGTYNLACIVHPAMAGTLIAR
jgi:plastocyanin